MNVVAYTIRVWQFSVTLSTFRSVGYGKDMKFSIFPSMLKKSMWHYTDLNYFFYFGGNFMSYLVVLVATGAQDE